MADDPLAPQYPNGPATPVRPVAGPPPRFRRAAPSPLDTPASPEPAPAVARAHRFARARTGEIQEKETLPADDESAAAAGTESPGAPVAASDPAAGDDGSPAGKLRVLPDRPLLEGEADAEAAATAVLSRRLRPRSRTAAEMAAAAALAADAPRHFEVPTPEEKLGLAASRWLRVTALLLTAVLLPSLGFLAGRWWHRRQALFAEEYPVAPAPDAASATPAAGARRPQSSAPVFPPGLAEWSGKEIAALDTALGAEQAGRRAEAIQLAQAQRASLADPRQAALLDTYLAELAIRERRGRDAQTLLFPLTRSGPYMAVASDRLAFIQCRSRRFDEATEYFGRAAAYDPLAGVYFYRWGEALRRLGKLQDASARFAQALLRQRFSDPLSAPPITAFKMRLTRIEDGQVAEVRAETDERMRAFADAAQPPQLDVGEWMLTAAALDLQESKFASATEWLRKARALLPGGRYEEQIADYFFRNFAHHSELAGVLPTAADADIRRQALAARPDVYFVDP